MLQPRTAVKHESSAPALVRDWPRRQKMTRRGDRPQGGGGGVKTVPEVRTALEKYLRKRLDPGIFGAAQLIDDAHMVAAIVRNLVRTGALAMNAEVNANKLAEA